MSMHIVIGLEDLVEVLRAGGVALEVGVVISRIVLRVASVAMWMTRTKNDEAGLQLDSACPDTLKVAPHDCLLRGRVAGAAGAR